MIWGVGTGRTGGTSYAKQVHGVNEPHPWLGPDCDPHEVIQGRLKKGVPTVDFRQSMVIPVITEVDPTATIVWLIRNPWDCVRSMVHTRHLRGPSSSYAPIADEEPVLQACLFWLRVNTEIHKHYEKYLMRILQPGQLTEHEGDAGGRFHDIGEHGEGLVSEICAPFWWHLRTTVYSLYNEKSRTREPRAALG